MLIQFAANLCNIVDNPLFYSESTTASTLVA
uniref:Uncharacterized protein n=1 Tax=Rhizophora mucronata TaxID=61149 RepID=A0A2P2K8E4_RHIMU